MKNLRLITRFYSTPIKIYDFSKTKQIKQIIKPKQSKNNSYKNMYNALKKYSKLNL